jgi:hypothetical protein
MPPNGIFASARPPIQKSMASRPVVVTPLARPGLVPGAGVLDDREQQNSDREEHGEHDTERRVLLELRVAHDDLDRGGAEEAGAQRAQEKRAERTRRRE